jgi:hypothetical protein
MKNSVVRFWLAGLLLASLASPALADGSPVPWSNKASSPVLQLGDSFGSAVPKTPALVVDGLPVPWPKKAINTPALRADGLPVPWPKKIIVQSPAVLIADGLPVPWPKKK